MEERCSYDDVSDEEISTCKERHSRLGEDNLNDTLEYDFGGQPCTEETFEEQKAKNNGLMANPEISQVAKTDFEDLMSLTGSVPLAPAIQPHDSVHDCNQTNLYCDLKDIASVPAKNVSTADSKDCVS